VQGRVFQAALQPQRNNEKSRPSVRKTALSQASADPASAR